MREKKKAGFDYFDYFISCARCAADAAALLNDTLSDYRPEALSENLERIHEIEHKADSLKHDMMEQLAREFMPPIEREDIITLAHELDNVVDAIDDVLQRANMFNVQRMRPDMVEFSALIVKCTGSLHEMMEELPSFKKASSGLKRHAVEVNTLESTGDALYQRCMRSLFTGEADARELIIWNTMFECMEVCLDACEHASDAVESVVMKNS